MATLTAPRPVLTEPSARSRIEGIDLLRGLVMIIMALDHTRDFFHITGFTGNPLDLQTTTPFLYFTRWITHFCAPVFVFLAGTSAYLQSRRKDKSTLSGFLMKRGLWLILIEVLIVNFGVSFDIYESFFVLQVIWATGISMFILGLLVWLPYPALFALGLGIVFGHNLLDYYEAGHQGDYSLWYLLLHKQGVKPLGGGHNLLIYYPFLPWTGVMIMGYCFGRVYRNPDRRKVKQSILSIALLLITLFIGLRMVNGYGNPGHWSWQNTPLFTVLSFIDVQKYPPSLLYDCMTLGPALIFLAIFGNAHTRLARIISVYGKVPFFYYLIHFYLLHVIETVFYFLRGHTLAEGMHGIPGLEIKFVQPGEGYSLAVVYLIWICVVVALYPLCKWYADYKRTHTQWWLSYL